MKGSTYRGEVQMSVFVFAIKNQVSTWGMQFSQLHSKLLVRAISKQLGWYSRNAGSDAIKLCQFLIWERVEIIFCHLPGSFETLRHGWLYSKTGCRSARSPLSICDPGRNCSSFVRDDTAMWISIRQKVTRGRNGEGANHPIGKTLRYCWVEQHYAFLEMVAQRLELALDLYESTQ